MLKIHPKKQVKDAYWTDEKGDEIPINRIDKVERLRERECHKMATKAFKISEELAEFKNYVRKTVEEIYEREMQQLEASGKAVTKGNFTFYNFEHTIRVKANISAPTKFTDAALIASKEWFDKYIDKYVHSEDDVATEIIERAYSKKNGQVDPKHIFDLLSFKTRTNKEEFHKGCKILEEGSIRTRSKTYYEVAVMDDNGEFVNIQLNFSKI